MRLFVDEVTVNDEALFSFSSTLFFLVVSLHIDRVCVLACARMERERRIEHEPRVASGWSQSEGQAESTRVDKKRREKKVERTGHYKDGENGKKIITMPTDDSLDGLPLVVIEAFAGDADGILFSSSSISLSLSLSKHIRFLPRSLRTLHATSGLSTRSTLRTHLASSLIFAFLSSLSMQKTIDHGTTRQPFPLITRIL